MLWIAICHSIYVVLIWCIFSSEAVYQVARCWRERAGLSRRRPDIQLYGPRLNSNPDPASDSPSPSENVFQCTINLILIFLYDLIHNMLYCFPVVIPLEDVL